LVYVDEMGSDAYLFREYARALRGEKVYQKISGKKYKRTSIVAGKCGKNIVAPLQYDGTMDSDLFEYWFEFILLKSIIIGSCIIMDNASFHRKAILSAIAEKYGFIVIFLPPYSPELNPIENFWGWLKNQLRNTIHQYQSFDDALSACFEIY
jgi:transposase